MARTKLPALKWHSIIVDGRPSELVKRATDKRSGAYAIRRKDSHGVVYVGESDHGTLWRTLLRHFQAPASFTAPKSKKGGANAFATDRPQDYEVGWQITTRGHRPRGGAKLPDQRALTLQAQWIAAFRAAGHQLKNRDDGLADAKPGEPYELVQPPEEDFADWVRNPPRALTNLGLLTGVTVAEVGGVASYTWPLRDAPILAYDDRGRLHIVYAGKVVRPSTSLERKEYKRTHWGQRGTGKVREGGVATPPLISLGRGVEIQYTTRKGADRKLVDYRHEWGEGAPKGKRWVAPTVAIHRCKGGCGSSCAAAGAMTLVGGTYRVDTRGIVG